MSLTSSLWNGASGLDASSLDLQVIGDNIANANTVGFKNSRADFEAQISQNLIGGQGQLGLGTELQTVQKIMTQGSIVTTNVATDLSLQGNGMFLLNGTFNGVSGNFYTRNGQFTIDNQGNLVNQSGLKVQGYGATASGAITGNLGNLQVGNATSPPQATANVTLKGNLDSTSAIPPAWNVATAGTTSNFSTSTTIYDSLGNAHQAQIYFRRSGAGTWEWHAVTDGGGLTGGTAGTPTEIANGTLTYNTSGVLTAQTQTSTFNPLGSVNPQALTFNFGTPAPGGTGVDGLTQFAGNGSGSAVTFTNQDGFATGTLANISVSSNGDIQGAFTNGQSRTLGQVALANFAAPDQLQKEGGNLYGQTVGSGQPTIGGPGSGGLATITAGALEQSNVDLSGEFVKMIAAQRDFQANARTVSAADGLLQTLMSISANQG